jgi:hypothetical protein
MNGTCRTHEKVRNTCNALVKKPQGEGPLVKSRCILEDNIKMDLGIKGCESFEWIQMADGRIQ